MNKRLPLLLLLAAVALSLWTHSMVFNEFVMPTYGNTMIHVASSRELVETGQYPFADDYSYGGGQPNLYVPVYRFAYAEAVMLTGLPFDLVGRLFVMLFAILLPLGFFVLCRELWGEWPAAAAALLASAVPELLIYTVRPLPQALGLALLPIAFYLIIKNNRIAALAATALVVLTHQEAGVFLVGCAFAFFALKLLQALAAKAEKRKLALDAPAKLAFACWLAGVAVYFGWHFFITGNLDVFGLAQFQNHEGGKVTADLLATKAGRAVLLLGALGAVAALVRVVRKPFEPLNAEYFALACAGAGLFACFNDLVGIGVFMDRFIVFLGVALIPLAALGAKKIFDLGEALAENLL
ncbi:hypothetical protein COX86_02435 [Candidatus Micrarchaeota archaeon CG_4_10_14_0_2_um_filter_60_11]|nr:MAG: hypothetical protein AUJ16_00035 [Candidatus Micrarchaeota archaeon CG1_02_60_51]PIN96016.1 MAG: hypothetical protein COU39_03015 [Candidatus Micrarchaeota archaeon CG10_big_fil_rev_8_21_14_0_10_60_32]PIO02053.1 MAG: hypothetical protein COT58_01915 [Candidatus Micrarchaeota archaeon CG09_land_8_20_14_0_10_60_16]PIZ90917.1 MAG: hypothetical protein COX86_02435 [Candidatus Micrarchaeota archaeon CG_4_10_14_0_2_um_filter_60_11]